MSFVVRPFSERDRAGFNHVRSRVYREGQPVRDDENILPSDAVGTVVESAGKIVGAATALDFDMVLGSASVRCAGVAAVGVLPECRRTGAGAALMQGAHRHYLDEGFAIASLFPFRETWYRKFGYETCGLQFDITVPMHRLAKSSYQGPIRELDVEEFGDVKPVYEAFSRRYPGMNLRKPEQWNRAIGMEKPFAIYAIGEPIEGYVMVRLEWDFWKPLEVREVVWTTPESYDGVLAVLNAVGMNKTALTWTEPADSPYVARRLDQGVTIDAKHKLMWRVLDVASCVGVLESKGEGSFSFRVHDATLDDVNGDWTVEFGDGRAVAKRGGTPGFSLSVQGLTQAIMGATSFADQVRNGLIDVIDPRAIETAQSVFTHRHVYALDRF